MKFVDIEGDLINLELVSCVKIVGKGTHRKMLEICTVDSCKSYHGSDSFDVEETYKKIKEIIFKAR